MTARGICLSSPQSRLYFTNNCFSTNRTLHLSLPSHLSYLFRLFQRFPRIAEIFNGSDEWLPHLIGYCNPSTRDWDCFLPLETVLAFSSFTYNSPFHSSGFLVYLVHILLTSEYQCYMFRLLAGLFHFPHFITFCLTFLQYFQLSQKISSHVCSKLFQ